MFVIFRSREDDFIEIIGYCKTEAEAVMAVRTYDANSYEEINEIKTLKEYANLKTYPRYLINVEIAKNKVIKIYWGLLETILETEWREPFVFDCRFGRDDRVFLDLKIVDKDMINQRSKKEQLDFLIPIIEELTTFKIQRNIDFSI